MVSDEAAAAADRWREVALSDDAEQRREDVAVAQLIDEVVRMSNGGSSQPPVDPARQHLLLNLYNRRHSPFIGDMSP